MNKSVIGYANLSTKIGFGLGLSIVAARANAALDISATVSLIGEAALAVLAIGVAVIAVKVGVRVYKWASSAL